jgi:hypothetical protein
VSYESQQKRRKFKQCSPKVEAKKNVYSSFVVSLSNYHKKTSDATRASLFRSYSHFSRATGVREKALKFSSCIPSQVVCLAKNYL